MRKTFGLIWYPVVVQKPRVPAPFKSAVRETQSHCLHRIPGHSVISLYHSSRWVLLDFHFLQSSEVLVFKLLPF